MPFLAREPAGGWESEAEAGPELSVVIPVYRSTRTLPALIARLLPVLDRTGLRSEVVLVDDGSPDETWAVVSALQADHPDRITAIRLMRNYGQHNALMCGFRSARGRLVLTLDDDLQHPPEEVPKLLEAMRAGGHDLVYGVPNARRHRGWRNAGSTVINAFYRRVFRARVTVSALRLVRRELIESTFGYTMNFTFLDGLLAWNTQRIGEVAVEHHPRAEGRSGYSVTKLVNLALNLFTNFSLLPLRLVSVAGLVTALGGFAAAIYYLAQSLRANIAVPGYASTIIAILVLGGVQLLALGIMGEYLGRLHLNVNGKPQYAVRDIRGLRPGGGWRVEGGGLKTSPSQLFSSTPHPPPATLHPGTPR